MKESNRYFWHWNIHVSGCVNASDKHSQNSTYDGIPKSCGYASDLSSLMRYSQSLHYSHGSKPLGIHMFLSPRSPHLRVVSSLPSTGKFTICFCDYVVLAQNRFTRRSKSWANSKSCGLGLKPQLSRSSYQTQKGIVHCKVKKQKPIYFKSTHHVTSFMVPFSQHPNIQERIPHFSTEVSQNICS